MFNGTGSGDYSGDKVDIKANVPEGFDFLRWMPITGGGHIERFDEETNFKMPDRNASIAAVFGKIESWFPPGDETSKTGILLPKPESGNAARFEHRVRVTLNVGDAKDELVMEDVWDKILVGLDWFPKGDADGVWHSNQLVTYWDKKESGTQIQRGQAMPKALFEEKEPGVYEGSVWYEGNFSISNIEDSQPILPKASYAVELTILGKGFNRKRSASNGDLLPIEVEIIHIEKERDVDGVELAATVSPGKDTVLRDEVANLRIKIPPLGNTDWDLKIDIEPADVKTDTLGTRGTVQTYDFGTVENGSTTSLTTEANGTTKAGPYDIKLLASKGGEETFKIVVNKNGKFKLRLKTADNKIDFVSQEFTVTTRIRKYGWDNASTTYDFNKHDKHFENAASSWGAFYQHPIDNVERLKAIGMTESELGRNPQNQSSRPNDIMTIGHPDDHVLDTLQFVAGHREKEVDPQNNLVRDMNYPAAAASPAGTAIHWGTCWVYHKAQTIANNPQPPPSLIPGPWRSWDDTTARYNGGGVNNYLQRVTRAFIEGRHPTDQTTLWPLLTNGKARK